METVKKNYLSTIAVLLISAICAFIVGFLLAEVAKIGLPAAIGFALVIFVLPLVWGKPELGLALIAFFLAFERIPSIDLGGLTLKINHILIFAVFVIFLIKSLAVKKLTIPRDPVRYLIVLFLASLTFSLTQSVNLNRSIQVFAFMLLMGIVYFTVTLIVSNRAVLKYVLSGLLIGALFQVGLGLFQFAGDAVGLPTTVTLLKPGYDGITFGFARVQGTAVEPLYFADYLFIPLFLTLILLLRGQSEKLLAKWLVYLLCALALLNMILAISRGAYLALAITVVILLVSQAKLIFRAKTVLTTIMIVMLVGIGSYLGLIKSEPRALEEFIGHATVNDAQIGESVVSRLSATDQAYEIFKDRPFFGAGLGNFGPIVQGNPSVAPDSGWFIVNNEYMELLAENGIVGLGMFLVVVTLVLIRALRAISREKDQFIKSVLIGLTLALIAILAQYMTFSTLYIFHIWFLIGLLSAVSYMSLTKKAIADE